MIKNSELKALLNEKGRQYVIMLYINRRINMTKKQLDYVLGANDGTKKVR